MNKNNYLIFGIILFVVINFVSAVYNGTGGTITTDGAYTIHTFTTNGTFTWEGDNSDVSVLVVAGGAGGGKDTAGNGGGGGAGGLLYNATYFVSAQSYTITVGSGGSGATSTNGTNSTFGTMNAKGGGAGGWYSGPVSTATGMAGGSGGGGGQQDTIGGALGGVGIVGQGKDGGICGNATIGFGGGGGGGASFNGSKSYGANNREGGFGGNGTAYSINGTFVYYAGGGGGSTHSSGTLNPSRGGLGGGGNEGVSGTVNSGGGGGGGGDKVGAAGNGSTGIVIIRYLTYGDNSPTITLNSPVNNTNSTIQNIAFNCTATDDKKVQNITFYLSNVNNGTNTSVFNNTQTIFLRTLSDNFYTWKCGVCDNATISQCVNSSVYNITIDSIPPVITFNNYTNGTLKNSTDNMSLNISVVDSGLGLVGSVCKFNLNGTNQSYAVSSGWCNITDGYLTNLGCGNHTIRVYVNDTLNNLGLNDSYVVDIWCAVVLKSEDKGFDFWSGNDPSNPYSIVLGNWEFKDVRIVFMLVFLILVSFFVVGSAGKDRKRRRYR